MQLLIEIPSSYYNACKTFEKDDTASAAECIIAHGTPLPEKHGDLIDASELPKHYTRMFSSFKADYWMYILEARFIDEAPIIIKATGGTNHANR